MVGVGPGGYVPRQSISRAQGTHALSGKFSMARPQLLKHPAVLIAETGLY
jgi:hypothetical protein